MRLRTAALLSAVATGLYTLLQVWFGVASMRRTIAMWHGGLVFVPVLVLAGVLDATLPVFYFGLYRSADSIRFPDWARRVALAVVCATGCTLLLEIALVLISRRPVSVAELAGWVAQICCGLLLLAAYRQTEVENRPGNAQSRGLRLISNIAAWWGAFTIVLYTIALAATPFNYTVVRNYRMMHGWLVPGLDRFLLPAIERLVSVACRWTMPLLVYWVRKRRAY